MAASMSLDPMGAGTPPQSGRVTSIAVQPAGGGTAGIAAGRSREARLAHAGTQPLDLHGPRCHRLGEAVAGGYCGQAGDGHALAGDCDVLPRNRGPLQQVILCVRARGRGARDGGKCRRGVRPWG